MEGDNVKRGLGPWADEHSEILILGSFPGEESLRQQSYYCSSRNQFWKIINEIFGEKDKAKSDKEYILDYHLALWDCLKSCERDGSLDENIRNKEANDLPGFLKAHPAIKTIVFNGQESEKDFYAKFPELRGKYAFHRLISTSGMVTTKNFEEKLAEWSNVLSPKNDLSQPKN